MSNRPSDGPSEPLRQAEAEPRPASSSRLAACCRTVALLAGSLLSSQADAAPAPLPRPAKKVELSTEGLAGTWTVQWGSVSYTMDLKADGQYSCASGSTRWYGTWGVSEGHFWISETSNGADWKTYAVKMAPDLSGPFVHGLEGSNFRLVERQKKK